MNIPWLNEHTRQQRHTLLQWKGTQTWLIRLCPLRDCWRTCGVHWLATEKKSVPCLGEKCFCSAQFCGSRTVTYVPGLVYAAEKKAWLKRVIHVNEAMRDILEEDLVTHAFNTGRKGAKNSPVRYSIAPNPTGIKYPIVPSFSIEETLYAMFGIRDMGKDRETVG